MTHLGFKVTSQAGLHNQTQVNIGSQDNDEHYRPFNPIGYKAQGAVLLRGFHGYQMPTEVDPIP